MVSFIKIFQPQKRLLQTMPRVGVKKRITRAAPACAYRAKHTSEPSALGGRRASPVQSFPVLSLKLNCHNANWELPGANSRCLLKRWAHNVALLKHPNSYFPVVSSSFCHLIFLNFSMLKFLGQMLLASGWFFFCSFFACTVPWTTAHDLVLSFNCYRDMNFNSN